MTPSRAGEAGAAASSRVGTEAATRAPSLAADLFTLTKPRVQTLLLFTTVTTMYVAGDPAPALVLATCLGGALSAGGAGAINHALDRDLDAVMARTATRPVPAGRISPRAAGAYGAALGVAAFGLLSVAVNLLAAALALGGLLGYVLVYTLWLKRRTPQNIVIGGAAGAVPPLVAWAAVTGSLDGTAIFLFALVFFWTPPHFWALSLLMKDEYARAGVPMLPVVRGEAETRWQIALYAVLLVAWSALPLAVAALPFGGVYLSAAGLLGLGFLAHVVWLARRPGRRAALRTYLFSLAYLAAMFAAAVADVRL